MTTFSASMVSLLTEINAVLLLALAAMAVLQVLRARRGTRAVAALVKAIKDGEPDHIAALQTQIKEQYGHNDEQAAEGARRLAKLKKTFYRHLVAAFMHRDAGELGSLDAHLNELVAAYRQLMPVKADPPPVQEPTPAQAPAEAPSTMADLHERTDSLSAGVEEIRRQNELLRKELEDTKHALQSTISEYVSAYSGGHVDEAKLDSEFHRIHDHKAPAAAAPKRGILEDEAAPAGGEAPPTSGYEVTETAAQDGGGGDDSEDIMALSDALEDIGLAPDEAAAISQAGDKAPT